MNNNNNKNEDDDDFKVKVRVGGKTRGARVDEFAAAARKSEHSFPPGKNDPLKRKKEKIFPKSVRVSACANFAPKNNSLIFGCSHSFWKTAQQEAWQGKSARKVSILRT